MKKVITAKYTHQEKKMVEKMVEPYRYNQMLQEDDGTMTSGYNGGQNYMGQQNAAMKVEDVISQESYQGPVYNPPPVRYSSSMQAAVGDQTAKNNTGVMTGVYDPMISGIQGNDPRPGQIASVSVKRNFNFRNMVQIGHNRYAVVSVYRGTLLVHVREYMTDANTGRQFATKKGIGLKVNEWQALKRSIAQIDAAISAVKKD